MELVFSLFNFIFILIPFFSQKRLDVFSPTSLCTVFLILYFAVSPIHLYLTKNELNSYTIVLVNISLLIYVIVYLITNKISFNFKYIDKLEVIYTRRKKFILKRCYFLILICVLLYFSLYYILGETYNSALQNPLNFRYKLSNSGFLTLFYSNIIKLYGILSILYIVVSFKNKYNFVLKSFFFFILNIILFLPLGSKGMILFSILKFVIVWNYCVKRISILTLTLFTPLLLIPGVYLQLTELFTSNTSLNILFKINYFDAFTYIFNRLDLLQNIDCFITSYFNNTIKPDFFYSFQSFFQQFIPREYFEEKPYLFSTLMTIKLKEEVFLHNVTYDFGSISESIFNFGIYLFFIPIPIISVVLVILNKIYFLNKPLIVICFLYFSFAFLPASLFASGFILTSSIVGLPLTLLPFILLHFLFFFRIKQ